MKVLLINPARTYYSGSKGVRLGLPLGLMYVAAHLEKNGLAVKIFDSLIHADTAIIQHPEYTYHGVPDGILQAEIIKEKPDLVGITCPFTAQIRNTIKTANLIKQIDPKIFIVVGGPHFAVLGKQFLQENETVQAAVIGEGEQVMLELAKSLSDKKSFYGIKGLIFRDPKTNEAVANPPQLINDLDSLSLPAYHLIDMERYFNFLSQGLSARPNKHKRSISMITSRGCPFNCVFCSIHLHMGKPWRAHSADYVFSHIKFLVNNYQIKHLSFEDDNFTFKPERCEKIIDQLIDNEVNISWDTPNGVRADTLNENLLRKMKKSGCEELIVGTESGDQETLDKIINKNLKLEKIVAVAAWCKKLKIRLRSFFVIGFPGETKEKIQKTIDFAYRLYKKYNVFPNLMIATPLFGTRLYDIVMANGYLTKDITPENLALAKQAYGQGMIKTSEFNPRELRKFALQLESRIARLNLVRKIFNPKFYFKGLKLILAKPKRMIFFLRRLKG
jgi:radical SAM superfamily enzyme YgiQ (UPF0313 family)